MSDDDDDIIDDNPLINAEWVESGPPPVPRRVFIRFNRRFESYRDGVEEEFPDEMREEFFRRFEGLTVERFYRRLAPETIEALTAEAKEIDPEYDPPDFLTFYAISLVGLDNPMGVADRLQGFFGDGWKDEEGPMIAEVFVELPPAPQPCPVPKVHEPAPYSVDIAYAHAKGYRGAGVRVVDIERVWNLGAYIDLANVLDLRIRPDLINVRHTIWADGVPPRQEYPTDDHNQDGILDYNYDTDVAHSTATLGTLAADCRGGNETLLGMIPEAEIIVVSSWDKDASGKWVEHQADAIKLAASLLKSGDVLLLEMQCYDQYGALSPVELNRPVWLEIEQAAIRGIVVVEPAGNNGSDLNTLWPMGGPSWLSRDSGAIMVGASMRARREIHPVMDGTNFGQRVDLHAWGMGIDTLNASVKIDGKSYGVTSGAAAVIAGVAALAQSAVIESRSNRSPLTGKDLRGLLKTGVPSPGIGHMPNLKDFIDNVLPTL